MMDPEIKDNAVNLTATDSDWNQRRLCSDESCIGVIGPDGRCKECGLPYAGTDPGVASAPPSRPAEAVIESVPACSPTTDPSPDAGGTWESRRLCSDENCIGVIGSDGRCKECGLPFRG